MVPSQAKPIFTIRPYEQSDLHSVYEAVMESLPELMPWMSWATTEYNLTDTRLWLESRKNASESDQEYDFAIIDESSGTFVGGVGLNHISRFYCMANLGYWVSTSYTGRGAASTAGLQLARFAFDKLNLQRVEIIFDVANLASQRVAQKMGAHKEGVLRNRICMRGKPRDAVMYSLIPADIP